MLKFCVKMNDEQLQFEVMDTKWYSIDITVQKG